MPCATYASTLHKIHGATLADILSIFIKEYGLIVLAIVLLIALSVGLRVWRTARENPAEVIKSGN